MVLSSCKNFLWLSIRVDCFQNVTTKWDFAHWIKTRSQNISFYMFLYGMTICFDALQYLFYCEQKASGASHYVFVFVILSSIANVISDFYFYFRPSMFCMNYIHFHYYTASFHLRARYDTKPVLITSRHRPQEFSMLFIFKWFAALLGGRSGGKLYGVYVVYTCICA